MTQTLQVAWPVADDLTGNWGPTPVYPHVNGPAPHDGSPAATADLTDGDSFEVKLAGLAWPSAGPQVLKVRLAGDGATPVSVALLQGGQVIAAATFTPPSSWQTYTLTLTDAQKAQISNYADLHVVVAGPVQTPCCPNPLPATLHGTLRGGLSGTMTFTASNILQGVWITPGDPAYAVQMCGAAGDISQLILSCNQVRQAWFIQVNAIGGNGCSVAGGAFQADAGGTCSPFRQTWTGLVGAHTGCCCDGVTFNLTVTG
jgi:hypothetical protein